VLIRTLKHCVLALASFMSLFIGQCFAMSPFLQPFVCPSGLQFYMIWKTYADGKCNQPFQWPPWPAPYYGQWTIFCHASEPTYPAPNLTFYQTMISYLNKQYVGITCTYGGNQYGPGLWSNTMFIVEPGHHWKKQIRNGKGKSTCEAPYSRNECVQYVQGPL